MKVLLADYRTYKSLWDIINKTSEERQLNNILKIVKIYINSDNVYNYFITTNNLMDLNEIDKFFNITLDTYQILEFLTSIKDQLATKYLLINQYEVNNIQQLGDDIIQLLDDNIMKLYPFREQVAYNFVKFLERNSNNPNLQYIRKAEELGLLTDEEDPIGKTHKIIRVDIRNRKRPFVDINHHIEEAKNGETTHGQILNRYFKMNRSDKEAYFRPSKRQIEEYEKHLAFGHLCNNNVIIIDTLMNLTIDEVVEDLKKQNYTDKIYYYIPTAAEFGDATREAKKIKWWNKI